jgi:hypothetical protein
VKSDSCEYENSDNLIFHLNWRYMLGK